MEQVLEALTNQNLSDNLEVEYDSHDKLLEKYTIEPLMPNISSKNSVLSANNGNENTNKEEFLTRLTYTLKKLEQCERDFDKNLGMDPSHPSAKDSFTQIKETLPENMEETVTGVMQSTQEYIEKLNDQLEDLDKADQQVNAFSSNFIVSLRLLFYIYIYIYI
jgi:glutaredoxin 2